MSKSKRGNGGRFTSAGNIEQPASADDSANVGASDANGGTVDSVVYSGPLTIDPSEFSGGDTTPVGSPDQSGDIAEPIKRGRGRPRKDGSSGPRPQKSGKGNINVSGVEKLLLGIHTTLSTSFRVPEIELDATEASELAKAYAEVAAYYPAWQIPDDVAAMLNLCGVVSSVYGSRLMAYRMRRAMEKRQFAAQNSAVDVGAAPVNPQQQQAQSSQPPAANGAVTEKPRIIPEEVRVGEIPGVGNIVFPADHPLMGGRKPH